MNGNNDGGSDLSEAQELLRQAGINLGEEEDTVGEYLTREQIEEAKIDGRLMWLHR
ncbi:MAG: hypothetical protein JO126_03600 [Alphaproteobacteria bacterium]|nr:hypothetical protein [Alphaproteobacteria bacterium]MBV8548523.1 hypothetical protein [Alphaproteobacteria bacterium]